MIISVVAEIIDYSAVRSIPPKTKGNRGIFASTKVPGGFVEYESQIERDFYLLLEHSPDVILYQHQPVVITYKDSKGEPKKYYPDTLVEFSNGIRVIVEIKDERTLFRKYQLYRDKWQAAEKWTEERGYAFIILTEREIRNERMANVWFTLGSSKVTTNNRYMKKLNTLLTSSGRQYNELCYELAETCGVTINKSAQIICYAIYHGLIFVDTFSTRKLNHKTLIRKIRNPNNSPFHPYWMELDLSLDKRQPNQYDFLRNTDLTPEFVKNEDEVELIKEITGDRSNYSKETEKKEKIVKEWLNKPSSQRNLQWRAEFFKKHGISKSTIYRWVKKYEKSGIDGLSSKYENRGRRSPYDRKAFDYLEKARKDYLKPNGTFKKAYRKLEKIWEHDNFDLPSKGLLKKYVYDNTTSSELALNKRGRRFHKSNYTPSMGSFQGAIMPMQVVQLDNTPFNVFPVDSKYREPLGTPHITAAIDCYTRMITGIYLSLSSPSSQSVLETLVQSILPKTRYEEIYDTQFHWPIQGFPVLILVDNGMDYRSKAVKKFCRDYDVILEYAPLRTPRYKAYIEQWFRILDHALNDEEVAGLRPLLKKRLENPDLTPQKNALLTTQEIRKWLYNWIIDKYHFDNKYDDLVPAPFLRWEKMNTGQTKLIIPVARDAPTDEWEIDMLYLSTLNRVERVLNSFGVRWEHLKYQSTELANLYGQIGPGNRVTLLLDRRDIRVGWVINPINQKPIRVGLGSGWAATFLEIHGDKPILSSAWMAEIKALREQNIEDINPYQYLMAKSRDARQKALRESEKATKRARRKREKIREAESKKITQYLNNNDNSTEIGGEIIDIIEEGELENTEENEYDMDADPVEGFDTDIDEIRKSVLKFSRKRGEEDDN